MKTKVDYAVEFNSTKAVPKELVMKLKGGSLLELKWRDAPNEVVMLLEKPIRKPGDVSLNIWYPNNPETGLPAHTDNQAIHSQVVKSLGMFKP